MIERFPIPDDNDDIGLRQFNLDTDELGEMYNRPKPVDYAVKVTLFYRDDEGEANESGG